MTHPSPLRVGLIGASSFAEERLLPAVQASKNVRLWSVQSGDIDRAQALATRFQAQGPVPCTTNLEAMLADPDLDAVLIASRDAHHAHAAISAARAGKHVFVEKPLALTLPDAEAIALACQTANVRCMVGYIQRHVPAHLLLRDVLTRGILGTIQHLHLAWSYQDPHPMGWRTQAGLGRWWVLAALGTHAVDLAEWVLEPSCGSIEEISAVTSDRVYHQGADETASITLRFTNGTKAALEVSCVDPKFKHIEIQGTSGKIICRDTLGAAGAGRVLLNDVPLPFTPHNPYEIELDAFCEAVRTGQDPPPNAEDGIRNLRWIERAYESSLQ